MSDMTESNPRMPRPIFIVGCQRSGTTMLRLVLDSHSHISCGPETRFLADLERIVGPDWKRLSQYGYSQEEWYARIAVFFDGVKSDYARSKGKQRWADKTPIYAKHLDFITKVFPDAQVIHLIRDGRDVALSHRKRFGYWSAVKATVKWSRYIDAARSVGQTLAADRYFEMRYENIVGDNENALRSLFEFLGEDWEPAVLTYNKQKHDVPDKYIALSTERRGDKQDQAIYTNRVGSFKRELDPLLRLLCWVSERSTLKELGYR
jgi:hypothetical protein